MEKPEFVLEDESEATMHRTQGSLTGWETVVFDMADEGDVDEVSRAPAHPAPGR